MTDSESGSCSSVQHSEHIRLHDGTDATLYELGQRSVVGGATKVDAPAAR